MADKTSQRDTTSNQRWNKVMYFNLGIYNVKQRRTNVVYFNVDVSSVRQPTLSFSTSSFTTLVNVETTLWKWPFLNRTKKIILSWLHWIQSFYCYFIIFFSLLLILRRIRRILAKLQKLGSWKILSCKNLNQGGLRG